MFHRDLPRYELSAHPTVQQLGITFPTRFATVGKKKNTCRSAEVLRLSEDYLKIISTLLAYNNTLTHQDEPRNPMFGAVKERSETRLQTLVSNFERLQNSGDMVFVVGGETIQAYSAIVSLWSDPLARMLDSAMREGITKRIEMRDEDPTVIKAMVTYFYTADVTINHDNALALLKISSLYDIASLRDCCCDYLKWNINISNCLALFSISHLHRYEKSFKWTVLLVYVVAFIKSHAQEILTKLPLSLRNLELDELAKIWPLLADARLNERNKAFLAWAENNWNVEDLPECITYISSMDTFSAGQQLEEGEIASTKASDITPNLKYFFDYCVMAVVEDFDVQMKQTGFQQLNVDHLTHILRHNKLSISSEYGVLRSIITWVLAMPDRDVHLPVLLKCVRFPFIDIACLVKVPSTFPRIGASEAFKVLLQEALRFQVGSLNPNKRRAEELEGDAQGEADGEAKGEGEGEAKREVEVEGEREAKEEGERKRRRVSEKYQLPQVDAAEFASCVTTAVLRLSSQQ